MAGEFLCCLPFTFCLKKTERYRLGIRNLRIFTALLFLLNSSTCITVGVQALLPVDRIPSLFLTRLTMLHLALDPCLLFCIFRQLRITNPVLKNLPSFHVPFSMTRSPLHQLAPHMPDCPFGGQSSSTTKRGSSSSLSDLYVPALKEMTTSSDMITMLTPSCGHASNDSNLESGTLPKNSNSFPKLCQHHQRLLRQHLLVQHQRTRRINVGDITQLNIVQSTNETSPCSTGTQMIILKSTSHI